MFESSIQLTNFISENNCANMQTSKQHETAINVYHRYILWRKISSQWNYYNIFTMLNKVKQNIQISLIIF